MSFTPLNASQTSFANQLERPIDIIKQPSFQARGPRGRRHLQELPLVAAVGPRGDGGAHVQLCAGRGGQGGAQARGGGGGGATVVRVGSACCGSSGLPELDCVLSMMRGCGLASCVPDASRRLIRCTDGCVAVAAQLRLPAPQPIKIVHVRRLGVAGELCRCLPAHLQLLYMGFIKSFGPDAVVKNARARIYRQRKASADETHTEWDAAELLLTKRATWMARRVLTDLISALASL
jgi:hypothetical protein